MRGNFLEVTVSHLFFCPVIMALARTFFSSRQFPPGYAAETRMFSCNVMVLSWNLPVNQDVFRRHKNLSRNNTPFRDKITPEQILSWKSSANQDKSLPSTKHPLLSTKHPLPDTINPSPRHQRYLPSNFQSPTQKRTSEEVLFQLLNLTISLSYNSVFHKPCKLQYS